MRLQNNENSIRQKELDNNLLVNPIEDGNTPVEKLNQGVIYTSELEDGYNNAYEAHILSIASEKTRTGNNNFFKIFLSYEVNSELPNGWFGNNLLKEGDPFSIVNGSSAIDFNYIKGYIVQILDKSVATVGQTATYTYTLLCSITAGDVASLLPTGGQIFKTNRRIFSKETQYIPPINLYSTVNESNNRTLFFWEDTTNLGVSYRVRVRSEDLVNYDTVYAANGNHAEFQGNVEPIMFKPPYGIAGEVTTFKFIDKGIGCSTDEVRPLFITSGTEPSLKFYTDKCGSLLTKIGEVKEILNVGINSVELNIKIKEGNLLYPIETNNFIDLPIESETKNAYVYAITMLNDYYVNVEIIFEDFSFNSYDDAERQILNKNVEFHIANITSLGLGLTKPPKIYYDKYPTNTKFIWPLNLIAGTYYWSVAACYDCNKKTYSEWSPEELLIVK
jgi:hypothetical protein